MPCKNQTIKEPKKVHSQHFYSVQYWKCWAQHSDKKMKHEVFRLEEERGNCPFLDEITLCIGSCKVSTQKLLELVNELSKAAEYEINTQKSVVFLYTNKMRKLKKSLLKIT